MDSFRMMATRNECMLKVFSIFQKVNKEISDHLEKYNKLNGFDGANVTSRFTFTNRGTPHYYLKMDGMDLIDTTKWLNKEIDDLFDSGVRVTVSFKDNQFVVSDVSIHVYSRTLSEDELRLVAMKLSAEGPIEVSR